MIDMPIYVAKDVRLHRYAVYWVCVVVVVLIVFFNFTID